MLLQLFLLLLAFPFQQANTPQAIAPNVAGTWKLNLDKSKLSTPIKSETLYITCSADTIQMRYTTDGHKRNASYKVDGKEHTYFANPNGDALYKAEWSGSVLRVEWISRVKETDQPRVASDTVNQRVVTWELSNNGNGLTYKGVDSKGMPVSKIYDKD